MDNNLAVWNAAKSVSTAVASIITTYRKSKAVKKQELAALEAKIKIYVTQARAHAIGEIIRVNIEEIASTQRYIDQQNLDGIALEMAIEQLHELNCLLRANLNNVRT